MEPSSQSHGACHHQHFRHLHCSHHHHHPQHCHHNQHQHQHHHPLCILRPHYLLPTTHNPVFHPNLHTTLCPLRYTSPPPIPSQTQFSIPVSAPDISNLEVLEEQPQLWEEEDIGEGEEEEEEEPMFVMTDEWMEFFAKSEEKRRLEKKQAKMLKKAEKKNKKVGE